MSGSSSASSSSSSKQHPPQPAQGSEPAMKKAKESSNSAGGKQTSRLRTEQRESLHNMKELVRDDAKPVEVENIGDLSVDDALQRLNCSREGLTSDEASKRLEKYGPNALEEKEENKCLKFLSFMWNPLSWVMEMAALVAIVLSNGPEPWLCAPSEQTEAPTLVPTFDPDCGSENEPPDWEDFIGIVILLILNSVIGYIEESSAGDAVAALMDKLSPKCKVRRDNSWKEVDAKDLVPGDVIIIKLGDIVPADVKLLEGEPMKIDQASLTGESLPVTKQAGDEAYSGTTVKKGEIDAVVYATGPNTFLGKAAGLVANTEEHGHLQQVLTAIGLFCMSYISLWILLILIVSYAHYDWDYRRGINMVLVVLIGGIPIAMPTVLSVTMALGVNMLAKKDAVVTRITAVEELAGMDILCSDKTGTLTLNKLSVDKPTTVDCSEDYVILMAALAARHEGDPDAIDQCIKNSVQDQASLGKYKVKKFFPFNPTDKRTEAWIEDENGQTFRCSKGAPQVMINLAVNADEIREEQEELINDFALRGLRALGVARSDDEGNTWKFVGLIPLLDPPRTDTAETIEKAINLGVRVKMITGDQVAIGKETARRLGMGLNFHAANVVRQKNVDGIPIEDIVEEADGFGEVFPEDKYAVVEILRKINKGPFNGPHLVGMTGDGVNDAPALKTADVGIAVSDATDAARSAADMVLLTEGLSVIIEAIIGSRKIFQRMKNYAIYACATTIRIVTSFGILAVGWQFNFPPFMILIIAYLNDGTIMTISKDRADPSPTPDAWRLAEIFTTAIVIGLYLTASTLSFFHLVQETTWFEDRFDVTPIKFNVDNPIPLVQPDGSTDFGSWKMASLIYLQVSITGQLVIFSTRARDYFFMSLPSYWLMGAFVVAQLVATLIAVYAEWSFTQIWGIGWGWAAIVWVWSLVWYLVLDIFKIVARWTYTGELFKANVMKQKAMFRMNINAGSSHMGSRRHVPNSAAYAKATSKASR